MLDLTKLPIGTRLRTRDGRSARLLATDWADWAGRSCLVAVRDTHGDDRAYSVLPDGCFHIGRVVTDNDVSPAEAASDVSA